MNKIVRDRYPVDALPDDLRQGLGGQSYVRVTIEETGPISGQTSLLSDLMKKARQAEPIGDDPTARIRKLRDEWDR